MGICFNWEFFFKIEIEKLLRLPYIKFNGTIILLKCGFHLSPHAAAGSTKKQKYYETFHTFELSLGSQNLMKDASKSDFKIVKQISPVRIY